ncbi:MAG: flagellar type III secretion system pore protein FliP [Candidatus Sericytochromatia bacterium]|nr:flagellar type III secretion system pore protein FliP [Candidatus Sericytochromatia bacterium]
MVGFQVDYGPYIINVAILVVLTIALGYTAVRLRGRNGVVGPLIRPRGRRVQVLERTHLEGAKNLYLVKCGNQHWVVGTSETSLSVLGTVEPSDPSFQADLDSALDEDTGSPLGWLQNLFGGRKMVWIGLLAVSALLLIGHPAWAADAQSVLETFDLRQPTTTMSTPLQLIIVMAMLTLLPFLFIMSTSFLRTVIVLGFLRSAMGTQQVPPNQVILGLSVFLTIYTMAPVWQVINTDALMPYFNKQISQSVALDRAVTPLKGFMLKQTRREELAFFVRLVKVPPPQKPTDLPIHVVLPAFMVSELSTSFKIGFMLFLPFLIVDLVVANTLLALGMMMLSPVTISLPFKLLIFTLADGWSLLIQSIVRSFKM